MGRASTSIARHTTTVVAAAAVALALFFVFASAADAKIILVKVTSPVRVGRTATLTMRASFPTTPSEPVAVCVLKVQIDPNHGRQLGRPRVIRSESEKVTWTWKAGKKPGRYRIYIACLTNPAFRDQIPRSDITFHSTYRVTK